MSVTHIQQSIENVTTYLAEHPEECRYTDPAATAVVEDGLRCRAEGPHGALLVSDMPKAIGGGGSTPSPSLLSRAAPASPASAVTSMPAAPGAATPSTPRWTLQSASRDRRIAR